MKRINPITQTLNDTPSGAAETTLREKIRGSWRGERKISVQKFWGPQNVRLSERDLRILRFVLEMKFASFHEVRALFFAHVLGGTPAVSSEWCQRRLLQLERDCYLAHAYSFLGREKYELITPKGLAALKAQYPCEALPKPSYQIDYRLFRHDLMVLKERVELESKFLITDWTSDRSLSRGLEELSSFPRRHYPDAIYRLPTGESIALEVEIARKSIRDYREKIHAYANYLRETPKLDLRFQKVRYVCFESWPYRTLREELKSFPSFFEIEQKSLPSRVQKRGPRR